MGDGGRGERVRHVVLTVQAHGHIAAPGGCVERESGAAVVGETDLLSPYVRIRGFAEEQHPGLRTGGHGAHERVVGVEDGDSVLGERLDHLALGDGDLLAAAELADVRGADIEDEADPRRDQAGEVADVADVARTHLEDEVFGALGGAQGGERQSDLVVEVARGEDGGPLALQELGDQVLGGGLARGAGEGDDCGAEPTDDGPGQGAERGDDVVDDDRRDADRAGGQYGGRARLDGALRVVVAVDPLMRRRRRTGCLAPPLGSR